MCEWIWKLWLKRYNCDNVANNEQRVFKTNGETE